MDFEHRRLSRKLPLDTVLPRVGHVRAIPAVAPQRRGAPGRARHRRQLGKRFASGGTALARYSRPKSGRCGSLRSAAIPVRWRWFLDEVFAKVNGKLCYLWREVDHEGEVLDAVVTAKRDNAAALRLLKRIMKRYGPPHEIVTDGTHGLLRCDEGDRSR